MNKDFQSFVALVSQTISDQSNAAGPVDLDLAMKLTPHGAKQSLHESLGDIIAAIKYVVIFRGFGPVSTVAAYCTLE
jgi:hypothetical protein